MNETAGTAARAWINPTESEQGAVTQIRRPSFRLISGLEYTVMTQACAMPRADLIGSGGGKRTLRKQRNGVQAVKV